VRRTFRHVDGIVFQTQDAMNWFPKKIKEKGTIIYNSVAESFYTTPLLDDREGIVATGRYCDQKNHKMLIEAFAMIANEISDDLYIYGNGSPDAYYAYAQRLGIAGRVHFPGGISDVPSVLKKHKLYVLSSDFEGMPNGLMEAMAMGLPVISTDCPCGGPKMLMTGCLSDNLVKVNDITGLASKMLEILKSEDKINLCGKMASDEAQKFKPSLINQQWEEFFNHIIKDC
jgi:glycosyltransferase involved in cell wall biosynthesis